MMNILVFATYRSGLAETKDGRELEIHCKSLWSRLESKKTLLALGPSLEYITKLQTLKTLIHFGLEF